ncbi:MAG: tetratricopeptide repeat protein, partial [Bacteroidales bacterium]|nr:tetratricopeptide repeat protein [Bacteroidales bacterium]
MLLVGQGLWGQQYGVKNIKSNDTLSIRSGPGAHTKKVGELPYNATEITRGYCTKSQSKKGPKKWCEVQVYAGELFVGWVAEKYLHEFSNAKQEAKYKNKKYKVIRHSPEEVLNVRAGMGSKFKIVEELAYNSKGIDILSCQKSNKKYKWCWINYGAQQGRNQFGWVFSKYLQLEKYGINNDQSIASNEEKIQKGIYEVTLEGLNIRDEPTGTRGKYVPGRVKGKAKKGMKVYADYFHGKWAITQYGTISRKYLKPSQIKFDKTMVLIDKNNTIDNLNILIKGDGEQCKVTMDKKGNNVSTNCLQPNDYTYCTNKRTICKSIYEIQYVFFRDEFPNIPERIVIRDYNEGSNLIKLNPKIEGIYEITVNGLEIDYEGKKITSKKGMKVYISPYSYSKSSQVVYTNYGRINRKYLKRSPIESDNIMVLLNANNRIDDLSILIKGNDEECKVTMDRRGKEISTNCVKPNFGTFCTERRTVCKGIHEIQYTFLEDVFPVDHIYILVNEFNRVNHFIEYKTKFKSSIGNLPLTDFCFYGLEYINTAFMSIQTSLSSEKINELKILLKETEELSKKCFDKDIYRDTWITGCFLGTDNIKKNIKKHMQEPYRIIPLNCSRIYRGFPVVAELIFYDRKENILTYKNVSHDMYYSSGYIPHEKVYDEKVQKKLATCQQKYIYMLTDVELGGIDDVSCEEISSKVIKNAQLNTSQKITKYMQQLHKECEQNNMDSCYKIIEYSDLDRAKELLSIEKKKVSKDNIRIAKIYNHMARLSRKNADTIGFLKKALALRKNALGEKHKDTAESYHDIGMYYIAIEDYPEGLTYLKKALQTREEVLGGEHEDTVESYYSLGNSYRKIGDYDKALKLLQKTLIIHENILGKETLAITYAYNSIGKVYNLMGNHKKALKYLHKALEIRKKRLDENNDDTTEIYLNIASAYKSLKDYAQADKYLSKSLYLNQMFDNKNFDLTYSKVQNDLGLLYMLEKDYEGAFPYFKRALQSQEKILDNKHIEMATTYYNMGTVYNATKRYNSAYNFSKKAFDAFLSNRDKVFQIQSKEQKELYLEENKNKIKLLLSTAYQYLDSNRTQAKTVEQDVLTRWLDYKGSVFDSENMIATLHENTQDEILRKQITKLLENKRYLA